MEEQLQRLVELQTEQNQLLKKHLWRMRFSLLTLLLLTTAVCCGLGFLVYQQQTAVARPSISPAPPSVRPAMMAAPLAPPPPQPQPVGSPQPGPDLFAPSAEK